MKKNVKRTVVSVASVAVLCLCGAFVSKRHNQNQIAYHSAIEEGQVQISNHNYTLAEAAFQNVSKEGQNNYNAMILLKQTQAYVKAVNAFEKHDFNLAKTYYQHVTSMIGGSDLLYQYSSKKLREINTIQNNETKLIDIYNEALDDSHSNKLNASNAIVNQLLNDATLHETYYQRILKQVKKLKAFNSQMTDGKSTKIKSSDLTLTNHHASNVNADHQNGDALKINGNYINKDQVLDARRLIQKAGIEAGSLSDQDIRVIIRQAFTHHQSVEQFVKAHPRSIQ